MKALQSTPAGVIFDFDDTILDNEYDSHRGGHHERSRLAAIHAIGQERGMSELIQATAEQSVEAFRTVKVTTFSHALWNMLCMLGLRHNPDEPYLDDELMIEITAKKDEIYHQLLLNDPKEVTGSGEFIRKMYQLTEGKIAIGSSGKFDDIKTYLETKKLKDLFPDYRIITSEFVKNAKPDPEVFNKAFDSLGLRTTDRPNVCVFEDDLRGIMAAKAAGLYACAITTRHTREEFLSAMVPADCVASSYAEFIRLFPAA